MTTQVTSAGEAAEKALETLLNDKIGSEDTEAHIAARAYAFGYLENGCDDLKEIATLAACFYDGYEAALARR